MNAVSTVVGLLNTAVRSAVSLILLPFSSLPPIIGLTFVSGLTAVLMLIAYKKTSNQEAIAETKRSIVAGLFEMRLFNDDLRALFGAQFGLLRTNLTYMRLNLAPLGWMLVPLIFLVVQLQAHYGYKGLEIDEPTVLTVRLSEEYAAAWMPETDRRRHLESPTDATAKKPPIILRAPDGIRIDSPPVWASSRQEVSWRVVPLQDGEFVLSVEVDGVIYEKHASTGDAVHARSPFRVSPSLIDQLAWPIEPALPFEAPLVRMSLGYTEATVSLFGWHTHWLITFFIFSIGLAFALKGRFGVTI